MATTISIEARPVQHGSGVFPCLLTGASPLCVDLRVRPSGPLPGEAEVVLTAHELFGNHTKVLPDAVPEPQEAVDGQVRLRLPGDHFVLSPGSWHILIDLMRGEHSLAGTNAGSTEVYVREEGESRLYSLACHNLARAEYAFDRERGMYGPRYRTLLPPTVDPFSDEDAVEFQSLYLTERTLTPDVVHHGGLGFLLAAHGFRALGRAERAQYCEEALARAVHTLCERMKDKDGRLHAIAAGNEQPTEPPRGADSLALKFLCQSYFYFRHGPPANKDYARYVLDEARGLFRYQLDHFPQPCSSGRCRAGDGRILAGPAWYCLAHKSEHGQFFSPEARRSVIDYATRATRQLLAADGCYDPDCPAGNAEDLWRGNLELVSALLPVWRMARILTERGDAKAEAAGQSIRQGIEGGLLLLTRAGAALGDQPPPIPSALPDELRGLAYEVCEQYRQGFRVEASVEQFAQHLGARSNGAVTESFAGLSAAGVALLLSPEYRALDSPPPLPWWQ